MDFKPVHGIHRPNHGLADALRKALLVPHVIQAYSTHYVTGSYRFDSNQGTFTKKAIGSIQPEEISAMQLAMVFEVCGRESDIGFKDDSDTYYRSHQTSCNAYKKFRSTTHKNIEDEARDLIFEAL